MNKRIMVSGAVIVKDGRVLLVRDATDDFWKVPGGRVEDSDKDIRLAASREIEEEVGAKPIYAEKDPWIQYLRLKLKDGLTEVLLIHWLADIDGEAKASGEVIECEWFDVRKLPKHLAPNIVPALQAFDILPKT